MVRNMAAGTEAYKTRIVINMKHDMIERILSGRQSVWLSCSVPKNPDWCGEVRFYDKDLNKARACARAVCRNIWDCDMTFVEIAERACILQEDFMDYSFRYSTFLSVWLFSDIKAEDKDMPYRHSAVKWYYC